MKYTLLELTQRILESMESDEVSSVSETTESLAVANIIKECYFDIVGQFAMSEQEGISKLDASNDNTKPCLMLVPSTVSNIKWLKYDGDDLRYVTNEEFFYYQKGVDLDDLNTGSMTVQINGKDFVFKFTNDRRPSYYTIFDDRYVIFDSYESLEETTLTETRSMLFGELVPEFQLINSWVPDLDPRQFQLLLQEAKAQAFVELKQIENPKAERKARKNQILTQKNKRDNDPKWANQQHVGFGRNGRNGFPRDWMQRAMRMGN